MMNGIELSHEKMIKARKLAFFISVIKAIMFFAFDLLVVFLVFGFLAENGFTVFVVSIFVLLIVFFRLTDFLKKIVETKEKLG